MGALFSRASAASGEKTGLLSPGSGTGSTVAPAAARMGVVGIAFVTFSCVAGGPFGIEAAVQGAGAFYTLLGLVAVALLWGVPQAMMTAELGAAIPCNGGPVVWVRRGLGVNAAFVNGILLLINQIADVVLYPTLVADYLVSLFGRSAITPPAAYAIKLGCTAIAVGVNILGTSALSAASAVLAGLTLLPFFLIPIVAQAKGRAWDWAAVGPAGAPPIETIREALPVVAATLLWCMQGWSNVGSLAGEVKDAGRVLPRGMALASILIFAAYSVPVFFGVALVPDLDRWQDGFLVTLASDVDSSLGVLMIIAAVVSNMSTFITSLAAYSRTLQAVVRENIVPLPALGENWTRWQTPVPAILTLAASTAALSFFFTFEQLVVVDSMSYLFANVLTAVAFMRLRRVEPHLARPFVVPGGIIGVYIAGCAILICAAGMIAVDGDGAGLELGVGLGACILLAAASLLWARRCAPKSYEDADGDDKSQEGRLLPSAGADALPRRAVSISREAGSTSALRYHADDGEGGEGDEEAGAPLMGRSAEGGVQLPRRPFRPSLATEDSAIPEELVQRALGGSKGRAYPLAEKAVQSFPLL
jgi:amino acid transporter